MANVMTLGLYVKNPKLLKDIRYQSLVSKLKDSGFVIYEFESREEVREDTDVVLSVGGDGTFLSAAKRVGGTGIPVLGVNLGRIGFLSENQPEEAVEALIKGDYEIEDRAMLYASLSGDGDYPEGYWPYSLNEVSVHRAGAAVLGIEIAIDGEKLPTYWADGLLIATSSGSTAYSLSVGGPICRPDTKVLIISPIAPHNLNIRPIIVPRSCKVDIRVQSRDGKAMVGMDNRVFEYDIKRTISVSVADIKLKRIKLPKSNFVGALTNKLFWGEDIRNNVE